MKKGTPVGRGSRLKKLDNEEWKIFLSILYLDCCEEGGFCNPDKFERCFKSSVYSGQNSLSLSQKKKSPKNASSKSEEIANPKIWEIFGVAAEGILYYNPGFLHWCSLCQLSDRH